MQPTEKKQAQGPIQHQQRKGCRPANFQPADKQANQHTADRNCLYNAQKFMDARMGQRALERAEEI
jgi:hypothetical protein